MAALASVNLPLDETMNNLDQFSRYVRVHMAGKGIKPVHSYLHYHHRYDLKYPRVNTYMQGSIISFSITNSAMCLVLNHYAVTYIKALQEKSLEGPLT